MVFIIEFMKHLITLLVTVFVVIALSSQGYIGQEQETYTIDMNKVVKAHYSLIGKAANNDMDASLNLSGVSSKITEAVQYVANGGLVLISPVVASKLENDITDRVILHLGLEIPELGEVNYLKEEDFAELKPVEGVSPKDFYEKFQEYLKEKEQKKKTEESKAKVEGIVP